MRKLIHSSFELDLSSLKISDTEENNWFSDSFFYKYTFPFEIDLTNALDATFEFISQYTTSPRTYYELKYIHNDKIEDAIFEIESHVDKLSCVIRFGYEQLPSFDLKLAELSLQDSSIPGGLSIYEHAQVVVTKTFPEVNYNFPQIHVDKYDTETDLWNGFGNIINNKINGNFLINENRSGNIKNRNIMQPLPYWIYILQRGMIDSGYILGGKILNDIRLMSACLYADVDYFTELKIPNDIIILQESKDASKITYESNGTEKDSEYFSFTLVPSGRYKITGTIKGLRWANRTSYFNIKYRNSIILFEQTASDTSTFQGSEFRDYDVNIEFSTANDNNPHHIEMKGLQYFTRDETIINLTISTVFLKDSSYKASPTIINENRINLKKSVPDITFLDFIKIVKNWFNYDLTIVGKTVFMNPIEDEINYNVDINLQDFEVKSPVRRFTQGLSFLLKFQDIDNKLYSYASVFHSKDKIASTGYILTDKTITIEIPALPLPIVNKGNVLTAYAVEANNAKAFLVNYNGSPVGNNLANTNTDYLIPAIHLAYWVKWFNFRINAVPFNWVFKAWNEHIIGLKAKTKIFAYNRIHIIKTINKTEIKPDLFEVDIETDALE